MGYCVSEQGCHAKARGLRVGVFYSSKALSSGEFVASAFSRCCRATATRKGNGAGSFLHTEATMQSTKKALQTGYLCVMHTRKITIPSARSHAHSLRGIICRRGAWERSSASQKPDGGRSCRDSSASSNCRGLRERDMA